ncbi:MAG: hypothetical protein WDO13_13430 [Verrucomicrobiota bacterium]
MRTLVTTLIAWLHHRRWLLHGVIVLFWGFVFLLPYVLVEVIPSHPAYLLRPLLSLDFGLADALARNERGTPAQSRPRLPRHRRCVDAPGQPRPPRKFKAIRCSA